MNLEISILYKSIKTYFTKDMLLMMLIPLIASFILMYVGFFTVAGSVIESFENYQVQIEQHSSSIDQNGVVHENNETLTMVGQSILDYLLKHTITSWIVSILFYSIGVVAMGYISIFISLLIIGFLTPKILSFIHKKDYSHLELSRGYGNIGNTLFTFVKSFTVMILLFIVLIPFYFIPILNFVVMFIPFYYFFHKMINFDVSSTILSRDEFRKIYFDKKDFIRTKTLLLYLFSLIPFVAFFIAIFYVIYIGISYFEYLNESKKMES